MKVLCPPFLFTPAIFLTRWCTLAHAAYRAFAPTARAWITQHPGLNHMAARTSLRMTSDVPDTSRAPLRAEVLRSKMRAKSSNHSNPEMKSAYDLMKVSRRAAACVQV